MIKLKYIPFILFTLLAFRVFSQDCILAGDKTLLYYTDIEPDKGLYWLYYDTDEYSLDLNEDNEIDFKIASYFHPSGFGGVYSVTITGLNGNEVKILSEYYWNNVDTLLENQSICDTGVWKDNGHFSYAWQYKGDRYIGVRLKGISGEFIYGWIKASYEGNFIIKEFGCSYYMGLERVMFPNPTNSYVNLVVPNSPYFELKLFSSAGALIFEDAGHPQRLDLSIYPAGVYFLKIITPSKTYFEKIVVTNQD